MSDTNVVVISGTLGADVDYRVFSNGDSGVAEIRIASNKFKPNPQSESGFDQYTTWTTVKFNGRVAKNVANKLSKGMKIIVTGELSEDVWADQVTPRKNQRKLYVTGFSYEVVAGGLQKPSNQRQHQAQSTKVRTARSQQEGSSQKVTPVANAAGYQD